MRAVSEINVCGAWFVSDDKRPRAWTTEGVTSFVVFGEIRFGFNDCAGAISPNEFSSDQFARTGNRITLEESSRKDPVLHDETPSSIDRRELKTFWVEIKRQLHIAGDRFAVTECRDELRFRYVRKRGLAESQKWGLLA